MLRTTDTDTGTRGVLRGPRGPKKSFKTQVGQKNDRLDDLVTLFFLATVLMEDFVHYIRGRVALLHVYLKAVHLFLFFR